MLGIGDLAAKVETVPVEVLDVTANRALNTLTAQAWRVASVNKWRTFLGVPEDAADPMREILLAAYMLGRNQS